MTAWFNIQGMTAIYLRVSTAGQSNDPQKRELLAYAKRAGYTSPRVHEDVISGTSSTRPQLDKLIADCRGGKVEKVFVWKLDRLGRSLQHLVHVIGELTRLKIPLICTSQGIDTSESNPAGKLQLNVLAAVAEFERELIVERTKAGLERAKASGVKLGRKKLNPKLRAQARALRTKGFSYDAIRKELGISKGKAIEFCS